MAESVDAWWARRRRSTGREVPYAVGTYREHWLAFPALARQYRPDLNRGIVLSQVPPAADVYLVWVCDVGHEFVATPLEQRLRPDPARGRRSWCPVCSAPPARMVDAFTPPRPARAARARSRRPLREPQVRPGEAFASAIAPPTASVAESRLRMLLRERLVFDEGLTAVRVAQPFHGRLEVWPDVVLADLRVALEYDTIGRAGDEHVGRRAASDRTKDRLLRGVGWEVVRIRCAPLRATGPHDIESTGVSARLADRVIDELRVLRGLLVDAYLLDSGG